LKAAPEAGASATKPGKTTKKPRVGRGAADKYEEYVSPEQHHYMSKESSGFFDLSELRDKYKHDPAFKVQSCHLSYFSY
jgi:hypothetical protein